MGLTADSTGKHALDKGLEIIKQTPQDKVIALAGNPNVGKSTVFNELTGLKQHTGNWPGKTVTNAQGTTVFHEKNYILIDIPGTYSLMAHSVEEEVARDFICFGNPDTVIVVCDGTVLERNMNLVLQTLEITKNVVVCVNLMDEAKKKKISIDFSLLSKRLGVPVIGCSARSRQGLSELMEAVEQLTEKENKTANSTIDITYPKEIEKAIGLVEESLKGKVKNLKERWVALRLLDQDDTLLQSLNSYLGFSVLENLQIKNSIKQAKEQLEKEQIDNCKLKDTIAVCFVKLAEQVCQNVIKTEKKDYLTRDRKIDRILTNRWTGIPIMLFILIVIFWITIVGANAPSQFLSSVFNRIQDSLTAFCMAYGVPDWLHGALVLGVFRVLAWVVAVMLPPMAIFFPLFTILEDLGYLPRVAFNLDHYFRKCNACGKQALTMAMGFGCNAAGIVGCRIIDSPRERLIAIITNNFVPCNGRFPTLIAIITMFFVGTLPGMFQSVASAVILMGIILLGIFMTFFVSRLLSATILKGVPSSFTLELPPFRRPQIGKVIVRSIFDRTLFVLGRAIIIAAPAGLLIWIMANVAIDGNSLLTICSSFLDPFAKLIGLDGVILMAFILGFPANEIVMPIILMAYLATGTLIDMENLTQLRLLLVEHGWTWLTAVCTMLFSLMHWPCSTTCMTIKKETGSIKWTFVSFMVPTIIGIVICFIVTTIARVFSLV